jgi:alpha-glucosidase
MVIDVENVTYWNNMSLKLGQCLNFVEHVDGTNMGLVEDKVARAWTDCVMHLGNTTTNKVESTHMQLKKIVSNSFVDIYKNWESIN